MSQGQSAQERDGALQNVIFLPWVFLSPVLRICQLVLFWIFVNESYMETYESIRSWTFVNKSCAIFPSSAEAQMYLIITMGTHSLRPRIQEKRTDCFQGLLGKGDW